LLALAGSTRAAAAVPVAAPFAVAHDRPLEAVEAVVAREESYTQLRVEFNGIQGDRVPAFLYVPRDAGRRAHPAVLLQYGSGGNKKTGYIVEIGRLFVARGFVVLTIDVPRRGERAPKEKKGSLDWLRGDLGRDLFVQYLGDYSRAVDYLAARPEVDRDRIGYVGISGGAITGVTFVAHEPRVRAMAALVGGGNLLGVVPALVPDKVREACRQLDPVHHVARIAPRPLLLVNVTRDQLVPRPFAEALHQAAGAGAKKVWLDCDHFFHGVDRTAVALDVLRFLHDSLPARGVPSGFRQGEGSR
jgi:dienelactone hydrolase